MRDLMLLGFLAAFFTLALGRPFLFVLAYAYVDIVAPQLIGYQLLANLHLSMVAAALAIGGWLIADARHGFNFGARQALMLLLLAYVGITTVYADFPEAAQSKWEWVWKSLFFAIFLPLTLRTRLRVESILLVMILSAAAMIITGGIKTILSGGGYGTLTLLVSDNSGLYEGSTASAVAIAIIPIILWLARHGTVFVPDWRVRTFCYALSFACLLIPIGTQTRTGLLCIAALAVLMLRDSKRRLLYIGGAAAMALMAVPFLPSSYTDRMTTIQDYQSDQSASTRLAIWGWTIEYVGGKPFGGGFEAYIQNRVSVQTVTSQTSGAVERISATTTQDAGRAWHSAYFEMLGEQGFPGLFLFLLIHVIGLARMQRLRKRYRNPAEGEEWIAPLATAFQNFQIVYLVGAAFIAVAFQPFIWMMLGAQIGFDRWVSRRRAEALRQPLAARIARRPAGAAGA